MAALITGVISGNAEAIAEQIITIVKDLHETYNSIDDEAEILLSRTNKVLQFAYELKECKGMDTDNYLDDLFKKLKTSQECIQSYYAKENKPRSRFRRSCYNVRKLFIYAPTYRASFNECIEALDALPGQMERLKKLYRGLLKPSALGYSTEFVNESCKRFWINIAGDNMSCEWGTFLAKYKTTYPTSAVWSDNDWDCVKQATCTNNERMPLFGFLELTKNANFPIEISEVPSYLDLDGSMGEIARIEIGKMIKSLIREFSSERMNRHIHDVHRWYQRYDKKGATTANDDNEKGIVLLCRQDMADECYNIIDRIHKEKKKDEALTEEEQLALDVDKARRAVSYFYQEFWVICEFGRLSRSIISHIEFPGEKNILDFIECFKPLDIAFNKIIKNHHGGDFMDLKEPKVYQFLKDFMTDKKKVQTITDDWNTKVKHKELEWKQKEEELAVKTSNLNQLIGAYKTEEKRLVQMLENIKKEKEQWEKKNQDMEKREKEFNEKEKELEKREKEFNKKEKEFNKKEKDMDKKEKDMDKREKEFSKKEKEEKSQKAKEMMKQAFIKYKDTQRELDIEKKEDKQSRRKSINFLTAVHKLTHDNSSKSSIDTHEDKIRETLEPIHGAQLITLSA